MPIPLWLHIPDENITGPTDSSIKGDPVPACWGLPCFWAQCHSHRHPGVLPAPQLPVGAHLGMERCASRCGYLQRQWGEGGALIPGNKGPCGQPPTPSSVPCVPPEGTPVNRIPIMAKQVLDLYTLYQLVTDKGGLVEVINKKIWREITKGLNLPTSITSAAFTLRTQ